MEITIFDGARDTKPDNFKFTWPELCEVIADSAGNACRRSAKLDHSALIFGRCEGRRANANVRFLSGLAADFDIGPTDPRYRSFDDMCGWLTGAGLAFIAYTTTANDRAHNKYRLLLPYAVDVPVDHARAAWHACNAKLGGGIDEATKDPARLSFLPARWTENPYRDSSKGLVTLVDPFDAIRVQADGKPILDAAEIAGLSDSTVSANLKETVSAVPIIVPRLDAIERAQLARHKGADDPAWMLLANLNHSPLVTRWMLQELPGEEGQRDYRFMRAVASQAVRTGLPITAEIIEILADQFSRERLHREPPHDAARQAENALAWALRFSASRAGPCQPGC